MKPPLPEPLPADPLPLVAAWLAEATASTRNPTAMALATVDPDGRPSARMVICRGFDARDGWLVFYTDRESAKGRALAAHPYASLGYCRHEGGRDFDDAANLLASTPSLVDALITHRFPIDDAPEAFRVAADKSTGALRVVVEPSAG